MGQGDRGLDDIEAEPAANTDITDEGAAAQKSAWLWGLEALAAESCPQRVVRLRRAASRRLRGTGSTQPSCLT